jgi:hypothetical protein
LYIKQKNGSERVIHVGVFYSVEPGMRPDETIKILPGGVFKRDIAFLPEDVAYWWDNRSRGSMWFDRPIIRLETSKGTVFKYRLTEEIWAYLQDQRRWEQYRHENRRGLPEAYFDDDLNMM